MKRIYFCDFLQQLTARGVPLQSIVFESGSLIHSYRLVTIEGERLYAKKITGKSISNSRFIWEPGREFRDRSGDRNFAKFEVKNIRPGARHGRGILARTGLIVTLTGEK